MQHTKIKTFEDACKSLGLNPKKIIPDFSVYPKKHQKGMIAHSRTEVRVRVIVIVVVIREA